MKIKLVLLFILIFSHNHLALSFAAEKSQFLQKADEYVRQNNFNEALIILKKAEKDFPDDIDIIINLACVYCLLDQNKKSIEYTKRILVKNPNHYGALLGMAENYIVLGKMGKAYEYLKKMDTLDPVNSDTTKLYTKIAIAEAYKQKYGHYPDMRRQTIFKNKSAESK